MDNEWNRVYRYHSLPIICSHLQWIDIDECEEYLHVNGCINSNGTYYCQCTNDNEKLSSNGHRCLSKY